MKALSQNFQETTVYSHTLVLSSVPSLLIVLATRGEGNPIAVYDSTSFLSSLDRLPMGSGSL